MDFNLIVSVMAGRFNASLEAFTKGLRDERQHADVILLTEMAADGRERPLREDKAWDHARVDTRAGMSEAVVTWADTRYDLVDSWVEPMSGATNGRGRFTRPNYCIVVLLRDRATGLVGAFVAFHLPAHIQGKGRLLRHPNARVWLANMNALRQLKARLRKRGVDFIVFGGDFNLDIRLEWVRVKIGRTLGLRNAWAGHTADVKRGTIGKSRLIDMAWLSGLVCADVTVHDNPGSDHRIARFALRMSRHLRRKATRRARRARK